jgi:hypothetical protein
MLSMGKSTISTGPLSISFNSELWLFTRGYHLLGRFMFVGRYENLVCLCGAETPSPGDRSGSPRDNKSIAKLRRMMCSPVLQSSFQEVEDVLNMFETCVNSCFWFFPWFSDVHPSLGHWEILKISKMGVKTCDTMGRWTPLLSHGTAMLALSSKNARWLSPIPALFMGNNMINKFKSIYCSFLETRVFLSFL